MRIRSRSVLSFSNLQSFYIEQWAAMLIGMICLGAAVWGMFQGPLSVSIAQRVVFSDGAVFIHLRWFLSIAVTLTGVSLLRFAFSKQRQGSLDSEERSTLKGYAVEEPRARQALAKTDGRG